MEDQSLDQLKRFHTRELLQLLKSARRCGGRYDPFYDGHGRGYTIDEIKSVLATREHIPNKAEAKKIRQEKARRK